MHGIWKCIDGIWKFFLHGMSLSLALPHEVKHHYWQHVLLHDSVKKNSRWRYVWCATVWLVWRCRNQSIFHEKKLNIEEAIHQILFQSWTWLKGYEKGFNVPSVQWLSNFVACIKEGPIQRNRGCMFGLHACVIINFVRSLLEWI